MRMANTDRTDHGDGDGGDEDMSPIVLDDEAITAAVSAVSGLQVQARVGAGLQPQRQRQRQEQPAGIGAGIDPSRSRSRSRSGSSGGAAPGAISNASAGPLPSGAFLVTASDATGTARSTNSVGDNSTDGGEGGGKAGSRPRRTKKVAKRKRRSADANGDGSDDGDGSDGSRGHEPSDEDDSARVPPEAAVPPGSGAAPPLALVAAAAAAAPTAGVAAAAGTAAAQVPQSNMTKGEWIRHRQQQRDERRRQVVADIVERRNHLSGDGIDDAKARTARQAGRGRGRGRGRSSTGWNADEEGDGPAGQGDGPGQGDDGKSSGAEDDAWSDSDNKEEEEEEEEEDGDGDGDGYFSGSPAAFVRRRRQKQMQQRQRRRSSGDFVVLDTTTDDEEDDEDDDGKGGGGRSSSSSEYIDSEDGDLSSSDDESDRRMVDETIGTRRSARYGGGTSGTSGTLRSDRVARDFRAASPTPRLAEAAATYMDAGDADRPTNADTPFHASFAGNAGPGGGGRRRTKKTRSAKRLATVSMPRTDTVPKQQVLPLASSASDSGSSGGGRDDTCSVDAVAVKKPAEGDSQLPQHPQPTAQIQGLPAGIVGQVAWNPAIGAHGSPPSLAELQHQQQHQLLHQLRAHHQYHHPHVWPPAPPGFSSHQQHNNNGGEAKAIHKDNPGANPSNAAPKRKRGRPRKDDSSGTNPNGANMPKKAAPSKRSASAPVPVPTRPKEVVQQEQPKRVPTGLVIPTCLEETMSKAVSLVAAEIKSGCWVRQWADNLRIVDGGGQFETGQIEASRNSALFTAAAALERFATEIILPTFISSGVKEGTGGDSALEASFGSYHNRTLAGTFLALREVLMMNSDSYFFDVGRSDKDRSDSSSGSIRHSTNEAEEKVLRSRLIASAVLLAAVNRLDEKEREAVLAELIAAIGEYDAAEDAFVLCLERADARSLGVLPNGKSLGREENIAWRVSFNTAREKHPLIMTKKRRDLARRLASYSSSTSDKQKATLAGGVLDDVTHRLELPKPNACAIYFVNGAAGLKKHEVI